MIQMLNGSGHPCAALSVSAASALPQVLALYSGARAEARAWHSDAALSLAQVSSEYHSGYYSITFLFVSPSARETLSLVGSQFGGLVGKLDGNTVATPLPSHFVDLAAAVQAAQRAGMEGAIDSATLTVWGAPGGPRLPAWLLHSPESRLRTFLIGALDGRAYPVGEYSYPVQGNDEQIQAMRQAVRQSIPTTHARSIQRDSCGFSGVVPMSARLAPWAPCNQAAVMRVFRQADSNYMMWRADKRPTED